MCLVNFGKFTKKIYYSLLSGVVLFFLLCMFSSSYCSSPQNAIEFENRTREIMSYMATNNSNYLAFNKFLNSNAWSTNKNNIPFSSYENLVLRSQRSSSVEWYIDIILYNGDKNFFVSNNKYINTSSTFTPLRYRFNNVNNGSTYNTAYEGSGTMTFYNGDSFQADVTDNFNFAMFYIDDEINNPNNIQIWGYNYPILDYFSYNYLSTLNDIIVDDDFDVMKQISNSDISSYVAEFGLYTNLDLTTYKPRYTIYKYMKPQNYFEPIVSYDYVSYQKVNDSLGRIYLTDEMLIPNTVIEINLFPIDLNDFSALSILFYVTDSNTIITSDSSTGKPKVDEDNTFTSDYYERYTNIINNLISTNIGKITNSSGETTGNIDFSPIINGVNDINNTLTDGSQTTDIINSYVSGDLPDVFGYQENFKTEYNLFWTPLNYLSTQIFNALTLNSTAEFHIPLRNGQTLVLSSDQFYVPDGALKSFISLYLVFATIYVVFLSFRRLINNLNSGGISAVLEKQGVDPDYIKM